jgi:hypothetical protein
MDSAHERKVEQDEAFYSGVVVGMFVMGLLCILVVTVDGLFFSADPGVLRYSVYAYRNRTASI